MGSQNSKLSPEDNTNNVQGQGYKRLNDSVRSNGINSSNNSCSTQSHKDTGNKIESYTNQNRIASPSGISCHELSPNQSHKEDSGKREKPPKDCEIERTENQSSSDVPSTLENDREPQNNGIETTNDGIESPRNDVSTASVDQNGSLTRHANMHTEDNSHEKDDTVTDTYRKKQNPSKKKKKKKGTAERLNSKRRPTSADLLNRSEKEDESMENEDKNNIRMVSPAPNESHPSAVTTEEVANDSERTSSSRDNGSFPDKPFNIEKITQEKNNEREGNSMTRPSSAVLFLASSLRTKQDEDDIIRQEPDMKIQAMTKEAERLAIICKNQHLNHRNLTTDNSLCPPAFLQSMSHIENCLDDLRRQIEKMALEKNGYLNRLSSVAGSMLTENNPNITDLNDPNRATKLAEKWCKIYDDEWTDALEALEKQYLKKKRDKHEQFVYHLFSLIKVIYKTCRKKAKEQVGIFLLLTNPSSTQVNDLWSQIPATERQNFTDSRKRMAEANIKILTETVVKDDIYKKKLKDLSPGLNGDILCILQKSSYFETCLKICWQFVIQDPPLYLDVSPLEGEKLNKDTHKEYTKSGTVIEYVVWPALYLCRKNKENGPLLAKGVVQPESPHHS
ncbi:uncharacterized protein LOC127716432 isoform X2 [Mytilus californianus]|uniref:uncharacterized protein LOC127716432 isoform X2 n=1 Tax=Mytilus californianus TaxID=6549 RepID=UPI0022456DDB|nr:uncharacterized protein LOC127716432 isoform X2 [Mytilus californianus]